jgi:hypothetical protein
MEKLTASIDLTLVVFAGIADVTNYAVNHES